MKHLATILFAFHVMFTYPTGGFPCTIQALVKGGPFESLVVCEEYVGWQKARTNDEEEFKNFPCQNIKPGTLPWRAMGTYPAGCGILASTSVGPFESEENCKKFFDWAKLNVDKKYAQFKCQRGGEIDDSERSDSP